MLHHWTEIKATWRTDYAHTIAYYTILVCLHWPLAFERSVKTRQAYPIGLAFHFGYVPLEEWYQDKIPPDKTPPDKIPPGQNHPGQNPPGQNPPGQNPPSIFYILLTVIYFINSSK